MADPVFRFLEYTVFTGRREILRGGEPVLVEPKVYELIVYLMERNERAVFKEELQEAIWPDVIVTESALTRCVMKARQAVGDDAKQQRIIRTVSRGGYRFIAPLERLARRETGAAVASRDATAIAVLPFANLSESTSEDYLASGLTLDISTDLSRNAWLFVIAPGSLRNYRSLDTDYQKLVDEFGVQYVVEGSVRRA